MVVPAVANTASVAANGRETVPAAPGGDGAGCGGEGLGADRGPMALPTVVTAALDKPHGYRPDKQYRVLLVSAMWGAVTIRPGALLLAGDHGYRLPSLPVLVVLDTASTE